MQIYILFSSLCLFKFNKNSKNRCYCYIIRQFVLFYFTKVRTNTEKIAWVIILTNLINRGEDMQVMYKKLQDRNKGRSRTHDMSQYINIGSHLPADSIIIFILHCKSILLLNINKIKSQ